MVSLLESDFCRWREFVADGARLLSAVQATHRQGGGQLMYGWMADSRQNYGTGYLTAWTELNVGPTDYFATANGGPYVNLDGVTEALYINDAAWQEAGDKTLLVWQWCNLQSVAALMVIASKMDNNLNNRSWSLYYDNTVPDFRWLCNQTGSAANNVIVNSTYGLATADTWYFVAGHIAPGATMDVWVGAATDSVLTHNQLAAGIPTPLFNGTAPLAMGTQFNNAPTLAIPWDGYLGVGAGRIHVPVAATCAGLVTRLFHMTRWKYMA